MKRKQSIMATITLAFALISSASAVEYMVTKSDGIVTTGFSDPALNGSRSLLGFAIIIAAVALSMLIKRRE